MHDTMGDIARIKGSVNLLRDTVLSNDDRIKLLNAIVKSSNHITEVVNQDFINEQTIKINDSVYSLLQYDLSKNEYRTTLLIDIIEASNNNIRKVLDQYYIERKK